MKPIRKLLRANGETMALPAGKNITWMRELIGATTLNTVLLRHLGQPLHVMLVDADGQKKRRPVNDEATELCHANYISGTARPVRGDVVIVPDGDFA